MSGQDPWISQTDRRRVVISGRLTDGSPCTVLFEEIAGGWLLWPFGVDREPVRLTGEAVMRAARELLGGKP